MTAENPTDPPRRPVSKRLRYEVLRRDDYTCRYCGADATDAKLTIDHVVPVALGGTDEPENLVTACADCNAGKTSTSPNEPIVEGVSDDALRWAEAMKAAARVQGSSERKVKRRVKKVDDHWCTYHNNYNGKPVSRPGGWEDSIKQFLEAGMEPADLCELIDVAMNKDKVDNVWRYFCGCVWRRLNERQAIARALIEVEDGEDS